MRRIRLSRLHHAALGAAVAAAVWCVGAGGATAQTQQSKRILMLPPLRWDAGGTAWHYALQQTATDLERAMGGLKFGLIPEEVSQHLRTNGVLHWTDLPRAKEFSEDVRYVRISMQAASALTAPVNDCFGAASHIVLLFLDNALFRVSWRFLPDDKCQDTREAAEDLYATYVPIVPNVAVSARYRSGNAEVVDVTDPIAGPLVAQRWQMQGQ